MKYNWISVEEQLPPKSDDLKQYLVNIVIRYLNEEDIEELFNEIHIIYYNSKDNHWYQKDDRDDIMYIIQMEISHWMELPDYPIIINK